MAAAVASAARRWRFAGRLLLALPAAAAHAEAPAGAPVGWICWYGKGTSVSCRLEPPDALAPAVADPRSGEFDAGVSMPQGKRPLPQIARTILQEPGKLEGKTISIPLFTESHDMDFVHQLAEAVMCGTRRLCSVRFLRSPSDIALALDAAEDPALN
ncbi:hypothetical protein [Aromatoleum evansii]|uniref:Uncharacterized protein n=1 Tax=Aromatoleum evansii TaxID=59406 RepID=A0ABZ1ALQ0_AROEV|nr:hypothetical protein [Aromatoleum evansii]NMG31778.1 hypothetical protein [Aromatoleum evansii]WRL46788.1 hypothetical protein U5817_01700 [Aromatoleum evansii]